MSAARLVRLAHPADPVAWRQAARALLAEAVAPECVIWQAGGGAPGGADDLFAALAVEAGAEGSDAGGGMGEPARGREADREPGTAPAAPPGPHRVPRAFLELAADVACHRDERRFGLLYRALWRLVHGEPALLGARADEDVHALEAMARAVRRDRHKMTAFVRFRRLPDGPEEGGDGVERYAAWFEPEHRIVRSTADFFRRRFATMAFSIFTPDESVHWDRCSLGFGPGASRRAVPSVEAMEELWREYYANIFNPARLKLGAMRAEMPVKYWKNLPEASLIGPLAREAGRRAGAMIEAPPTRAPGFAVRAGLAQDPAAPLRGEADGCEARETGPEPHSEATGTP